MSFQGRLSSQRLAFRERCAAETLSRSQAQPHLGKDGKTVAKGDAAGRARRCLEIIQTAIEELGGQAFGCDRTRILLTRMEDWEQVATVHGEFFGSIRPATTIMQVVRFIDPDWLVEIEADAAVES